MMSNKINYINHFTCLSSILLAVSYRVETRSGQTGLTQILHWICPLIKAPKIIACLMVMMGSVLIFAKIFGRIDCTIRVFRSFGAWIIYTSKTIFISKFKTDIASQLHIVLRTTTFVSSTLLALLIKFQATTINDKVIPYAFPSKPSDELELFPCVYFAAYNCLPGCCPCNSRAPIIFMSLLQFVRYRLPT